MGRIVLFVRVSTIGQQLESQEDSLRRAALADGYNEADFIVIGKKESAIKLSEEEREGLNELKNLIETEEIECVYIAELSRLSRRPEILYSIRRFLFENKVQLKCLKPSFTLLENDRTKYDAHANIIFSLFGALAEQEMLEKKERFARGKRRKADEGKYSGGAIPFGYRIDAAQDNLIVIDDEDSKIVKMIFDMYDSGLSQPKLAREMAEIGHPEVTLSMINNVLNNKSYCGVKIKNKSASYARTYPPIITEQQYDRCRKIADSNNVCLSKAKNIYYAERLVKCPTCGAYWSAGGSKASYHCPNAYKAMSIWKYDNHKKQKCTNKTSFSINSLDSILWHVAIEKEALYIEQANEETLDGYIRDQKNVETKIANVNPRLEKVDEKLERLASAWIDGSIRRETYEKKKRELSNEKALINREKTQYQEDLKRISENIKNLTALREKYPLSINDVEDIINGKVDSVFKTYQFTHAMLKLKIGSITDDKERQKIIKHQIKYVEVIPTKIRFPFGIGIKDSIVREVIVHSYLPSISEEKAGKSEGIDIFFVIPNGGHGPMILDITPEEITFGETPMFYSYKDDKDYYFEDITDSIFLLRYRDRPKRIKRDMEHERLMEQIGDRLTLTEASRKYKVSYSVLYSRIQKGLLPNEMLSGKYYVHGEDVEVMIADENSLVERKADKVTLFSVSKWYNKSYSSLRTKAINGLLPCECLDGVWYIKKEDVRKLFRNKTAPAHR